MSRNNKQASQDYYNRKQANHYTDYHVRQPQELMDFLMAVVTSGNRTRAKQLLTQRMVYVDKVITTQYNTPLRDGQLVQIAKSGHLHTLNNPFVHIVYEDAFLIVIDKAPGILTNAPLEGRENNVKRILDEYLKRGNKPVRSHTVHRLDRYTSGLMVFAKRRDVQEIFMEHWQEIVTDRRYEAVVEGRMERDTGTVRSWLYDDKRFMTHSSPTETEEGRLAITHYHTLQRSDNCSLVEFKLETGRKNQIRVHMQDLHHPVVGDLKYGAQTDPIGRVCLHAYRLAFIHPITHEQLQFDSPVPVEFGKLMKSV
ncbi:MAG: RluA family pseudouridine synthase [Bacteroidaceae bacterium]|nr:RluA family pseudouridine synthase [Bacteroidaceae bacterium]